MKKIIRNLAKEIKNSNEAFEKMTKAEKRVQIAKDVLERMRAEQLKARQGTIVDSYIYTYDKGIHLVSLGNLKPLLNSCGSGSIESCEVCAKGALFMAFVGRVNGVTGEEFYTKMTYQGEMNVERTLPHQKLKEIFSIKQLDLIETAFEGTTYLDTGVDIAKAEEFYDNFDFTQNKERLEAICQNIIENKGTFKP